MSLTKLSLAGNNVPNPSPLKVWSKIIQESCNIFLQCRVVSILLSKANETNGKFFYRVKDMKGLKGEVVSVLINTASSYCNRYWTDNRRVLYIWRISAEKQNVHYGKYVQTGVQQVHSSYQQEPAGGEEMKNMS